MTTPSPHTVPVHLGDRSYRIEIERGLLHTLGFRLKDVVQTGKVAVVTDRHVAPFYLATTLRSLRAAGFDPIPVTVAPGERHKNLSTVSIILDALARQKFERLSNLLALGGGVVGDLTGFAAAIYQRGISFVQVPTTLVAQVDSSVGGKTGVDHRLGKNLIGAFHQPRAVFIDPSVLETLPKREWVAGLAEVIKYGVIADEAFFSFLERDMPGLLKLDHAAVMHAISRSCEIKAQIVAEDERESDRRRILNYGHTIGHALEALAGYRGMIHGEAVGVGLVQEAELAAHLGICGAEVVERIRHLVAQAGLPQKTPNHSFRSLWAAMQHDKKVVGGQVIGVWPVRIGEVVFRQLDRQACADWYAGRRSQDGKIKSRWPQPSGGRSHTGTKQRR